MYVSYRDDYREQTLRSSESWQWSRCTSPVIVDKTGMELCAELSLPNDLIPPHGSAVARVYLNKRDTYTGVHLDASYTQSQVSNSIFMSKSTLFSTFVFKTKHMICVIQLIVDVMIVIVMLNLCKCPE